jgi:gluconate 2-dehydrogenase gamma chain
MNRRESLKAIGITTISTGLLLDACKPGTNEPSTTSQQGGSAKDTSATGLQKFEAERLKKLDSEAAFFDDHERNTLILLADIIIPKDDVSGSASDAKVIDFIEFIVKDIPEHQVPMRGGLKWLDLQCLNRYEQAFTDCTGDQQIEIVKEIAYPLKAKPEMHQGAVFFERMRSLTATGFYTSKIGIKDLGYVGNNPNKWEGVPADVLAQYNLTQVSYGV